MLKELQSTDDDIRLANHQVIATASDKQSIILKNSEPLELDEHTMLDCIDYWAKKAPNTVCMRERSADGWLEISYRRFAAKVKTMASHLGSLNLGTDKPLMIIAPNSINHAIVSFAAMTIGIPINPISVAYALHGDTFNRLNEIIETVAPGAIFFSNTNIFTKAATTLLATHDIPLIAINSTIDGVKEVSELAQISADDVARKRALITQDTVCKILMTSGSTGSPKGVINTHRMMYSNQVALFKMWPFLKDITPSLVSWLPWSHTFGGNVCVNITLFNGGTLTIDDGKPIPSLIGRTIENITLIEPNIHFNVPAGLESLLAQFEDDHRSARIFFSSIKVIFVAGAALPNKTRDRLAELSYELIGSCPKLLAGWGSTETAPFATCVNFETDLSVNIGIPMPGTEIKLTPSQNKQALAVRGPNVTPGYWNNNAATVAAFDDDGFYSMGDAGRLVNENNPSEGLIFAGRTSENFKLSSGTWVNVNEVRIAVVTALKPYFLDAVITGHNQSEIGILIIPNLERLAVDFDLTETQKTSEYLQQVEPLIKKVIDLLNDYNVTYFMSSRRVNRFAFLPQQPSIERNEITDKGYLNQNALLENWTDLIKHMHSADRKHGIYFHKF